MKQLIKRLSRVSDSSTTSSYALLRSDSSRRCPRRRAAVPCGHVPVYVGEEMDWFVVRADLVNHPVFVKLLNRSAQEYGYQQKGALRIACNVLVFEKLLDSLRCGKDVSGDVIDLIGSSSDEFFL